MTNYVNLLNCIGGVLQALRLFGRHSRRPKRSFQVSGMVRPDITGRRIVQLTYILKDILKICQNSNCKIVTTAVWKFKNVKTRGAQLQNCLVVHGNDTGRLVPKYCCIIELWKNMADGTSVAILE